jgi:hypothetical protein
VGWEEEAIGVEDAAGERVDFHGWSLRCRADQGKDARV